MTNQKVGHFYIPVRPHHPSDTSLISRCAGWGRLGKGQGGQRSIMSDIKYKRILLKISGEALAGKSGFG
ncbi:MAG TPA: hypothetical protein VLE49_07655, partial [Anaerolineales bacterium]|nr:hypothetical protein [Anaerolineales bacterium]